MKKLMLSVAAVSCVLFLIAQPAATISISDAKKRAPVAATLQGVFISGYPSGLSMKELQHIAIRCRGLKEKLRKTMPDRY